MAKSAFHPWFRKRAQWIDSAMLSGHTTPDDIVQQATIAEPGAGRGIASVGWRFLVRSARISYV
jgi:hypothetical protein